MAIRECEALFTAIEKRLGKAQFLIKLSIFQIYL